MLEIRKDGVLVGRLDARLRLTTKDPKLRDVIEQAKVKGLAHWFKPDIPDRPRMPLYDGVRIVKAGDEEFITELRRELKLAGYTTTTTQGRRS